MKKIITIVMLLLCVAGAQAQRHRPSPAERTYMNQDRHNNRHQRPEPREVSPEFDAKFAAGNYEGLPYRLANTAEDLQAKKTLVIYLHGRGASGNDNKQQLTREGVAALLNYLETSGEKATLLVPQCPERREWNESNGDGMTTVLHGLIEQLLATGDYDTSRVFILGDSMGGSGVWRMVNDYPTLFAAAMPVASVPRNVTMENLTQTPIYTVIGKDDHMASPDRVKPYVKILQKSGGKVEIEIMKGCGHREACDKAFTNERIARLMNKKS